MKIKLDENFGDRGADLLRDSGHDVTTVRDQDLCGTPDDTLIEVCRAEQRVLITLDMDFSNPIHFPPARYAGIVVIRTKPPVSTDQLFRELLCFTKASKAYDTLHGQLWVIFKESIRAYAPNPED